MDDNWDRDRGVEEGWPQQPRCLHSHLALRIHKWNDLVSNATIHNICYKALMASL